MWDFYSWLERDLIVSLTLWRLELDWNMLTEESPSFTETALWEGAGVERGSLEWESINLVVVRTPVGPCGRSHGHGETSSDPIWTNNRKETNGTIAMMGSCLSGSFPKTSGSANSRMIGKQTCEWFYLQEP